MTAKILYSKPLTEKIKEEIRDKKVDACLKVISVGNDKASESYVSNKKKFSEFCGIRFKHIKFEENITQSYLVDAIKKEVELNDGDIIVQLPLPKHLNEKEILDLIPPSIYADGFHPENLGKLVLGLDSKQSCTPMGIMKLLEYYNIDIEGKNCVVIGRSNMVGKPMAALLTNANGTVTICHSKTKNLKDHTINADIIVVAMGKPEFLDYSYFKPGSVVVDVGIHRKDDGKLCGDVLQDENLMNRIAAVTPVPGGVGPMTVASLLMNVIK